MRIFMKKKMAVFFKKKKMPGKIPHFPSFSARLHYFHVYVNTFLALD